MPRCYDCTSEDVTVKVIDQHGFELWFCAEDWAAEQQFHEAVMKMLDDAVRDLSEQAAEREVAGFKPLGLGPLLGKQPWPT